MAKSKTEPAGNPNYHMGKYTGYQLINGEYHIAPMYQGRFEALRERELGIRRMLDAVTGHAAAELAEIAKSEVNLWRDLGKEKGLDLANNYKYIYSKGIVHKIEEPK